MEMTIREAYNSTLLNIYNNALESIKFVDEDGFKNVLIVNYINSMYIIILNTLKDEGVTVSDFDYLVLQLPIYQMNYLSMLMVNLYFYDVER